MSEHINPSIVNLAAGVCDVCPLGTQTYEGDAFCPSTANSNLVQVSLGFWEAVDGKDDDESVSFEVFGDTVDERQTIETTVGEIIDGQLEGIREIGAEAVRCAMTVGLEAIVGVEGLMPTRTYTRLEVERLARPR